MGSDFWPRSWVQLLRSAAGQSRCRTQHQRRGTRRPVRTRPPSPYDPAAVWEENPSFPNRTSSWCLIYTPAAVPTAAAAAAAVRWPWRSKHCNISGYTTVFCNVVFSEIVQCFDLQGHRNKMCLGPLRECLYVTDFNMDFHILHDNNLNNWKKN